MKQDSNQLKAGIVLNYVNMILGNLIPIFYTPVMLSLLGQSEYGLYKLSMQRYELLIANIPRYWFCHYRYLIKSREEHGQEAEEQMLGLIHGCFPGYCSCGYGCRHHSDPESGYLVWKILNHIGIGPDEDSSFSNGLQYSTELLPVPLCNGGQCP